MRKGFDFNAAMTVGVVHAVRRWGARVLLPLSTGAPRPPALRGWWVAAQRERDGSLAPVLVAGRPLPATPDSSGARVLAERSRSKLFLSKRTELIWWPLLDGLPAVANVPPAKMPPTIADAARAALALEAFDADALAAIDLARSVRDRLRDAARAAEGGRSPRRFVAAARRTAVVALSLVQKSLLQEAAARKEAALRGAPMPPQPRRFIVLSSIAEHVDALLGRAGGDGHSLRELAASVESMMQNLGGGRANESTVLALDQTLPAAARDWSPATVARILVRSRGMPDSTSERRHAKALVKARTRRSRRPA